MSHFNLDIVVTAQDILSEEPFSPDVFREWILRRIHLAQLEMKVPNPSEEVQQQRRIFEFLDASTEKTNVKDKQAAIKLLKNIDGWETRNINPSMIPKVKELSRAEQRAKQREEERVRNVEKIKEQQQLDQIERQMRKEARRREEEEKRAAKRKRDAEEKFNARDDSLRTVSPDPDLA
jgi:hypothetical protein